MIITLGKLKFSNCFSYGEDNEIDLAKESLTQLIGKNGAGKTSIPIILQEVLYGKNIKSIKKQDIENRDTGIKGYKINLTFYKNKDIYEIDLQRKSSIKLKLFKNGEDISSHTSVNTYKQIAKIVGIDDFKVFSQLIYQSSTDSLEFLTATDTNRKKFLITLLQLEKYLELHEHFKKIIKENNSEILTLVGSIQTTESWIEKHEKMELEPKEPIDIPDIDEDLIGKVKFLEEDLKNIQKINNKIISNNDIIDQLDNLDIDLVLNEPVVFDTETYESLVKNKNELEWEYKNISNELKQTKAKIDKFKKGECPTCGQEVELDTLKSIASNTEEKLNLIKEKGKILSAQIAELKKLKEKYEYHKYTKEKFAELHSKLDESLPRAIKNKADIEKEIKELKQQIVNQNNAREKAITENNRAHQHNSKVKVIKDQIIQNKKELGALRNKLAPLKEVESSLEVLKKTFSTNGLISYKIESSVKGLEKIINEYLSEISHFQIYFTLSGDKLNIEVLDDSRRTTSIDTLSTGEKARINIATILAIRKVMSSLASTKVNLLFLDEVISVVDDEGKDQLAELLLKESLNTFMVSHGYEHPLVPKVYVTKEEGISRIEDGRLS